MSETPAAGGQRYNGPSLVLPDKQGSCFALIEFNFINTDSKHVIFQVD